jgi:hypothetical protein
MRYLLILVLSGSLFSCSNSEMETLKAENEALKISAQECQAMALQEAMHSREAEARALMAMEEAEKQAIAAAKAMKDCEGK